jgi:hypothetical protein
MSGRNSDQAAICSGGTKISQQNVREEQRSYVRKELGSASNMSRRNKDQHPWSEPQDQNKGTTDLVSYPSHVHLYHAVGTTDDQYQEVRHTVNTTPRIFQQCTEFRRE